MKIPTHSPLAWFVTGTDTEIGKTFATCTLLLKAGQTGFRAAGLKPVAAGTDSRGKNEDVESIRAAANLTLPEEVLNPYRFHAPVAPHLAAEAEGEMIRFTPIIAAVDHALQVADRVLVEGVGGFRVPLGPDGDSADLAVALGLPVILVVGMRLGCINHALLTVEGILQRRLALAGWVANRIDPDMSAFAENLKTLSELIPAPCLGVIPHCKSGAPADAVASITLPA